ncbi:MAG: SPOR domain-containing protein [Saprospiraceae bacterium]|nr:SPOR domain-containing protein [Saprospiraceae bacterium]
MESFVEIYSGEIMTAFFMLILMLILVVNLLLKSQNQTTESLRVPSLRDDMDHRKLKKQRRELGSITSVALLSFVLIAGLYFAKNQTDATTFKAEIDNTPKQEERPKVFYPKIGVNKERVVQVEEIIEPEKEPVHYSHPPILPLEYDEPKTVSNEDGFSCQVGAYSSHDKARNALNKWSEDLNIEGFIALQEAEDGRQLYKVFLGYFATLNAAKAFTKKLGTGYARSTEDIPNARP